MPTGPRNPITYHFLDCLSRGTGQRVRIVKVRKAAFTWPSHDNRLPTDQELYSRKEDFLRQLEIQQAVFMRRVCVLYLSYDYSNSWEDVVSPLFRAETLDPSWQPALLVM